MNEWVRDVTPFDFVFDLFFFSGGVRFRVSKRRQRFDAL